MKNRCNAQNFCPYWTLLSEEKMRKLAFILIKKLLKTQTLEFGFRLFLAMNVATGFLPVTQELNAKKTNFVIVENSFIPILTFFFQRWALESSICLLGFQIINGLLKYHPRES